MAKKKAKKKTVARGKTVVVKSVLKKSTTRGMVRKVNYQKQKEGKEDCFFWRD